MQFQFQEETFLYTPVVLNHVGQFLPESGTAGWIGSDYHVSLIGKDLIVPASAPGVSPCVLRPTMDIKQKRVFLGEIKVVRVDHPRMDLYIITGSREELTSVQFPL